MQQTRHYHLMGIGGAGMSTLAELLVRSGAQVSGCDARPSPELAQYLAGLGIAVVSGHSPEHLRPEVRTLVVSSAIPRDHPEREAARQTGMEVVHRAELLARLVEGRRLVAVAGAHGKTTVTALCAHVLERAGLDPLAAVGFALPGKPTGARWGLGAWAVVETDESDGSFLKFRPDVAVVTNVEPDHLENYQGSFDQLVAAYQRFLEGTRPGGAWIIGVDSPVARELAAAVPARDRGVRLVTYGLEGQADWSARSVHLEARTSRFVAWHHGRAVAEVHLSIPGRHNVANALAAMAAAELAGVEPARAAMAMTDFRGARRRFEVVGERAGVLVVDDYAHHPTEVQATLKAAAEGFGRPVLAIFQPHRYHRTAQLFDELAAAFDGADRLILTEIYAPPPEKPVAGVSGSRLAQAVAARPAWQSRPQSLRFCPTLQEALQQALAWVRPGDLVLVMGAGDVTTLATRLVQELAARDS